MAVAGAGLLAASVAQAEAVRFDYGLGGQSVASDGRTVRLMPARTAADGGGDWRLTLSSGAQKGASVLVVPPVPTEPRLVGWNSRTECGRSLVYVTLRYPPPEMADTPRYLFQTYAFQADPPRFLDSADVAFAEIALAPGGPDLGNGVTAPQPVQVACSVKAGVLQFHFRSAPG